MNSFKLSAEQIQKATQWWTEAIKKPRFDNGDSSRQGGMAMLLAMLLADEVAPDTEDNYEAFRAALEAELKSDAFNPYWGLDVDYGPDRTLAAAANASGINTSLFPWKTHMWFKETGEVQVSAGYGAETITL